MLAGDQPQRAACLSVPAPQVHHQTAVAPRGERRAGARLRGEDPGETLAHQVEPPVGKPLYLHMTILPPSGDHARRVLYGLADSR